MAKPKTEVRKVRGMGRGVFALSRIPAETLIEQCPVILFNHKEGSKVNPTQEYSFRWTPDKVAIALGNGSLYNHSYEPNARTYKDSRDMAILIVSLRPIKPGEQILINYNGEPDDRSPLWF